MKIETLYKQFLLTKASHLPVLGASGDLIGLLSKEKVLRELADLGEEKETYDSIPSSLLDTELQESFLHFFKEASKIPVLNAKGETTQTWDKPRFLAEYHKLDATSTKRDPKVEHLAEQRDKKKESQNSIHWYMEQILANFPDGLLSTDVQGNTVFYNEAFESKFLSQDFFQDSLERAEQFLKNLNRDLFASYLKENDLDLHTTEHSAPVLQTVVSEILSLVRVITLKKDTKVIGFLYHLSFLSTRLNANTSTGNKFPNLEEALQGKFPMEKVLEEVEARFIYETLKLNKNNISHSAEDLGIPRTTLQNRIKYLKLTDRFREEEKSPEKKVIPRKRSQVKSAPPKKGAPAKKEKKKSPAPKKKKKTIPKKKKIR
ncbi:CBS domain-containing protein [Leptospira ryugenii]|uniref:CBS domain-containing protein n=1 Tax=Leptospira ryugenii TaxID=1917863 RepID=UPI000D598079|nr:CBS domain-containing protein [Leptospira ryugenii]